MPPVHDLREFTQNFPDAMRGAGHEVVVWFKDLAAKMNQAAPRTEPAAFATNRSQS